MTMLATALLIGERVSAVGWRRSPDSRSALSRSHRAAGELADLRGVQ